MSDLLTKFKEICNTDIELPQSGKISVTKLNIEFQNKLFSVLQDLEGEANISINYIQFINNYIFEITKKDTVTFIDKLFLLTHWKNEIDVDNKKEIEFKDINLNEQKLTTTIQDQNVEIYLKTPTLKQENDILSYLLSKETLLEADILFFDLFRFIDKLVISDQEYKLSDTSYEDLYKLYLLFDFTLVESITTTINNALKEVANLRSLEADFSFFIDL
tara:strand:- start:234 stop:887 length:654 start_codon:yes stop_codon:yes gene_type:complete